MNESTQQEDLEETAPDSGTARARPSSERAALEELESEDERRFFSEPPVFLEQHQPPSLEPVVTASDAEFSDDGAWLAPSPEEQAWLERAQARRTTLRRWVVLAMSTGALALLIGAADRHLFAQHASAASLATRPRPKVVGSTVASTAGTVASTASIASPPETDRVSLARATPSDAVSPVPEPPAPSADAQTLLAKARALFVSGHTRDGVVLARAAIASDPLDARSYVLLGAGLQDLGEFAAARDVFQDCARTATRGPHAACRYFARR
jgi:hypothetical protein